VREGRQQWRRYARWIGAARDVQLVSVLPDILVPISSRIYQHKIVSRPNPLGAKLNVDERRPTHVRNRVNQAGELINRR
jgi:hypothetical protein